MKIEDVKVGETYVFQGAGGAYRSYDGKPFVVESVVKDHTWPIRGHFVDQSQHGWELWAYPHEVHQYEESVDISGARVADAVTYIRLFYGQELNHDHLLWLLEGKYED